MRKDLIDPIAEYGRDKGLSVTGGYVYRGKKFPQLDGLVLLRRLRVGPLLGLK